MRSLRSLKCLKTTLELTFTTKKANACSPWTTFSVFKWKYLLGKFGPKNQNCYFERKFCTSLIWICRTMQKMCCVHFLCFIPVKTLFEQIWSKKKKKIVSLSLNLVPRLTWICGMQWWCSIFLFLTIKIFFGQIWFKNSKLFVQSEIRYKDWLEYAKFSGGPYFLCFRLKIATLFGQIWS